MKLKTLKKKIHRLEIRLQEGPGKLAKMKRKLAAFEKKAAKAKRKKGPKRGPAGSKSVARKQPSVAKKPRPPRKVKRKLNLSPERRAQLAAAMKARWAAKRAMAAPPPQGSSMNPSPPQGHAPGGY